MERADKKGSVRLMCKVARYTGGISRTIKSNGIGYEMVLCR